MVSALEGYKFLGPKGISAVRPQDHALLQPMFRVELTKSGSRLVAKILGTASTFQTAPPVVAMRG
jgi:branched-chain amino acid transport system substrate-binding protein